MLVPYRLNAPAVIPPIWITKNNTIVSGHRRVNACKQLGIEEKPEAVKDIDEGKKTVHSVYGAIQQEKQKQEMWLIVGERCVAVKNTMCGLKQHRTA